MNFYEMLQVGDFRLYIWSVSINWVFLQSHNLPCFRFFELRIVVESCFLWRKDIGAGLSVMLE